MGKKFYNKSNRPIQFGAGNKVGPGETIELNEELVKLKSQAIEQLIAEGELVEGTKPKDVPKGKGKPKEEELEEEELEEPKGKKK